MHSEYIYDLKQTDASETLWYLIEQLLDDAVFYIKLWRWLTPYQMCIIFHTKDKLDIFYMQGYSAGLVQQLRPCFGSFLFWSKTFW